MSTQRQTPRPKPKPRIDAAQPAAQQSSPQGMAGRPQKESERRRNALDNQGAQGRHPSMTMREEEDDDTATRH
jgi:hypothetical protein